MRASNRIRELIGSVPDPAGFRVFIAKMLAAERPELTESPRTLRVTQDGTAFEILGERRTDLGKHRLLTRLLRAFITHRVSAPGSVLTVDELIEAGWPGEKTQREAALNRVYVAIAALRRAGLSDDLERSDGGYRLKPSTVVRLED